MNCDYSRCSLQLDGGVPPSHFPSVRSLLCRRDCQYPCVFVVHQDSCVALLWVNNAAGSGAILTAPRPPPPRLSRARVELDVACDTALPAKGAAGRLGCSRRHARRQNSSRASPDSHRLPAGQGERTLEGLSIYPCRTSGCLCNLRGWGGGRGG